MRGGLHLLAHKDRSTATSIVPASIPKQVSIVFAASHAQALVGVGECVMLGQSIACHDAAVVHASVSGAISSIQSNKRAMTIVIDNDGRDQQHESVVPIEQYSELSPEALRERIAHAGIVGMGGATFSTAAKLQAAADNRVPLLIINGAECEPFIACDAALMCEHADDVVLGTQALLHASGAKEAIIAIEADKPQAIAAMSKALTSTDGVHIHLRVVTSFYPTGGERQLIKLLTGDEVPSGSYPPQIGVLCQNVGTAAAIAQLIKTGLPVVDRIVTIAGSGIAQPRNLRARIGTSIASLVQDCGGCQGNVERLIMGGPMMGVTLDSDDTPVTAATNCIIAATPHDLKPRGAEMPCIRCGDCAHTCPAGLLPQQLLRYVRLHDHAALTELGLRDCIECGCCDYVCPSQIPLTSLFATAKHQQ